MNSTNQIECCFLSRTHRYIFECLLDNKERSQALCRHLFPMPHNAHLGANFIASPRETYKHVPYLAQYFITNENKYIFVDLHEIFKDLIQNILLDRCDFLQEVDTTPTFTLSSIISPEDCKIEFIDKEGQSSILVIQPIFHSDSTGRGFYPNEINPWTLDFLIDAISHQRSGQQAVILFLALNSAITSIHPAHHIDSEYVRLLDEALQCGVKIATARTLLNDSHNTSLCFRPIFESQQQSL